MIVWFKTQVTPIVIRRLTRDLTLKRKRIMYMEIALYKCINITFLQGWASDEEDDGR